jgi:hypothetical protein
VLNRLQLLFPLDYNFHPLSFQFPEELPRFKRHAKRALQPDAKPHAEGDATDTDEVRQIAGSARGDDDSVCLCAFRLWVALMPKETLWGSGRQESECSSSEDERDDGPFFILKPDAGCKGRVRACGIPRAPE